MSCTKRRFADRHGAEVALTRAHSKGRKGRWTNLCSAYRCDRCGFWHLTSKPTCNPRQRERVEFRGVRR